MINELFKEGEKAGRLGIESVDKVEMKFPPAATSLSQFKKYRFFTPAILYLRGMFDERPLVDFQQSINRHVRFLYHNFMRPVFSGLHDLDGNTGWNHTLWAIEEELWEKFESFMVSVTSTASVSRRLYRTVIQNVVIPDPLGADRLVQQIEFTNVVVFCVDSNIGIYATRTSPNAVGRLARPGLNWWPASEATRQIAAAMFQEDAAAMMAAVDAEAGNQPVSRSTASLVTQSVQSLDSKAQPAYFLAVEDYKKRKS